MPPPASPPMPPPRPPTLDERQAPAPEAPRATSSPVAEPVREPAPQPTAPVETHRPFDREAMRACGEEWARMKRAGATRNVVWRDFAAECLPRFGERQR